MRLPANDDYLTKKLTDEFHELRTLEYTNVKVM